MDTSRKSRQFKSNRTTFCHRKIEPRIFFKSNGKNFDGHHDGPFFGQVPNTVPSRFTYVMGESLSHKSHVGMVLLKSHFMMFKTRCCGGYYAQPVYNKVRHGNPKSSIKTSGHKAGLGDG